MPPKRIPEAMEENIADEARAKFSGMNEKELKKELDSRDLDTEGGKDEYIKRLTEAAKQEAKEAWMERVLGRAEGQRERDRRDDAAARLAAVKKSASDIDCVPAASGDWRGWGCGLYRYPVTIDEKYCCPNKAAADTVKQWVDEGQGGSPNHRPLPVAEQRRRKAAQKAAQKMAEMAEMEEWVRQKMAEIEEWEQQNRERHDRLLRQAAARRSRRHLASALGQWKEWLVTWRTAELIKAGENAEFYRDFPGRYRAYSRAVDVYPESGPKTLLNSLRTKMANALDDLLIDVLTCRTPLTRQGLHRFDEWRWGQADGGREVLRRKFLRSERGRNDDRMCLIFLDKESLNKYLTSGAEDSPPPEESIFGVIKAEHGQLVSKGVTGAMLREKEKGYKVDEEVYVWIEGDGKWFRGVVADAGRKRGTVKVSYRSDDGVKRQKTLQSPVLSNQAALELRKVMPSQLPDSIPPEMNLLLTVSHGERAIGKTNHADDANRIYGYLKAMQMRISDSLGKGNGDKLFDTDNCLSTTGKKLLADFTTIMALDRSHTEIFGRTSTHPRRLRRESSPPQTPSYAISRTALSWSAPYMYLKLYKPGETYNNQLFTIGSESLYLTFGIVFSAKLRNGSTGLFFLSLKPLLDKCWPGKYQELMDLRLQLAGNPPSYGAWGLRCKNAGVTTEKIEETKSKYENDIRERLFGDGGAVKMLEAAYIDLILEVEWKKIYISLYEIFDYIKGLGVGEFEFFITPSLTCRVVSHRDETLTREISKKKESHSIACFMKNFEFIEEQMKIIGPILNNWATIFDFYDFLRANGLWLGAGKWMETIGIEIPLREDGERHDELVRRNNELVALIQEALMKLPAETRENIEREIQGTAPALQSEASSSPASSASGESFDQGEEEDEARFGGGDAHPEVKRLKKRKTKKRRRTYKSYRGKYSNRRRNIQGRNTRTRKKKR